MTKTELQSALAEATQTDKRTSGVFLETLSALAYKEFKKNGEFVLPGFGKLVKQRLRLTKHMVGGVTQMRDSLDNQRSPIS